MNKIILIVFIFICISINAQDRYASVYGGGDGTSTSSPWSYSQAFASATAGMTVYFRGANAGNLIITQTNNGTPSNPINFIGCDDNWNPTVTTNRATYSHDNRSFSGNVMPLFWGGNTNGNKGNGTAITIQGDNVHLEGFSVQGYDRGVSISGDNSSAKNLNIALMGDFRANNAFSGFTYYSGVGFHVTGSNFVGSNMYMENVDAEGYKISADATMTNIEYYQSDDVINPVDYPYLFDGGSTGARSYNITLRRVIPNSYKGSPHGLVWKSTGSDVTDIEVDGFYLEGYRLEMNFSNCFGNTVKNGTIDGLDSQSKSTQDWESDIAIINGASNNLFENITIKNSHAGVKFSEWDDIRSVADGDAPYAGHSNDFVNIVMDNIFQAAIQFKQSNSGAVYGGDDNRFFNLTVNNAARMFRIDLDNSNTQFYNSTFKNVPTWGLFENGETLNTNSIFNKVNTDGVPSGSITPYNDTDVTAIAYSYNDVSNGDYGISSDVLEIGGDFTSLQVRQGFDIKGLTRTSPYTLGAYERNSSGVANPTCNDGIQNGTETGIDCGGDSCESCESTVLPINSDSQKRRSFYIRFFDEI